MSRPPRGREGFALILTILIVGLVAIVSLEFNTSMRSELQAAVNLREGVKLRQLARSGFDCALALLYEDQRSTGFDSLLEDWADPEKISVYAEAMAPEGSLGIQITDHSGRIQLNRLVYQEGEKKGTFNPVQKRILLRLLNSEEFGLEPDEAETLLDALKDWMDPDQEVTRLGAEDSYYRGLERPYACKDGPFDSLEELLLVRGITRELFYGTEERPGLSRYITLWGDGKININTAEPLVLRALSEHLDREMVEEMVAYRGNEDNDISQPGWYKKVPQMSSQVAIDDLVTTSSTIFEIRVVAARDRMRKGCLGFVQRDKERLRILSWKGE